MRASKRPKDAETRRVDAKGRATLFSDFSGHLICVERISDDELRIRKVRTVSKRASLTQLLEGVTAENLHDETGTGPAVGGEAW